MELPRELLHGIFQFLSRNERAVTLRLVSKEFRSMEPRLIQFREAVPPHAFQRWYTENCAALTHSDRSKLFAAVCASGCLENLLTLLHARCPWSAMCFLTAATADQLPVLEWLLLEGCPLGSEADRRQVLLAAALHGSLATLRWAARVLHPELSTEVLRKAAAAKHAQWREKIEWLLRSGCPCCPLAPFEAAKHGRMDVLRLLYDHGVLPTAACHAAAVALDRTDITDWLEEQAGVPLPVDAAESLLLSALQAGCGMSGLRWLVEKRRCALVPSEAMACAAARSGDVAVLSYTLEPRIGRGFPADWPTEPALAKALLAAAASGQFAAVRHLVEVYDVPLSADVAAAAAAAATTTATGRSETAPETLRGTGGSAAGSCVELLRWLLSKGCPMDGRTIWNALTRDDLESADLAYGASLSGPFRSAALVDMTVKGSLAAMRWMVTHGSPLEGIAFMAAAARAGNLDKIQWLYSQRCDWSPIVFAEAAASGNGALVAWLASKWCPMGRDGGAYLAAAAHSDEGPDWSMLRQLREVDCPWGPDTFTLATQLCGSKPWMVELLTWMVASGCPYDPQVVERVATASRRMDLTVRVARAAAAVGTAAAAAAASARSQ
ncbi:hypothetical protein PLESTB_001606900 [Pleodorina starrii]|uniref:F-box domain-containing protein n=1 Tax=Pleodorina starrii TaxID=330485 RepID=A0A9W6F8M8_9CHLO|nr:hypothetical protein PLESTM_000173700 [Pleodorina starrii]GLC60388.1 hypothetical protein PLESTB_001606900 [Pleodorina starrii]GLC64115.1 hypothetical protein PLESTF_000126100 [Pleodorina starrii]